MTNKSPRKPKEIAAILRALKANGKEAGLPARLAGHASYQEHSGGKGEWVVGANYEDGSSSLVLRDGHWFYRDPHTGEDSPCKGGYSEALAEPARCVDLHKTTPMKNERPHPTPAIQVNFFLVGHGYQMDIVNFTNGKEDVHLTTICRDFADSYDVTETAAAIEQALPKAMQKLERDYLQSRVLIVKESKSGQSSAISEARTFLATRPRDCVELRLKPVSKEEQNAIRRLLLATATEDRFKIIYDE